MITVLRFITLVVLYLMSCGMIAAILYAYDHWAFMSPAAIDWEAYFTHFKWPAIVLGFIIVLMSTPIGDVIIGLFLATRPQTLRDEKKLKGILQTLEHRYKENHGIPISPRTHVMDLPTIDGIAYGRRTMAVSSGLLKTAHDEEIAGVLAHEIGHLHHKDGFFGLAFIMASWPFYLLSYALGGFMRAAIWGEDGSDADQFWFGLIVNTILLLWIAYYAPLFLGLWLISWPIIGLVALLEKLTRWPVEYKADKFAADMGFAPALISLFERIEDEDVRGQEGFLAKYGYSHPPTALRIDRLERYLLRQNEIAA